MGIVPKSLLLLEGVPLIERQLSALQHAGIDEVVIVTGYHHEPIEAAITAATSRLSQAVRVVRNTEPHLGQQSSVRLGVAGLESELSAVLIALADQPLIGAAELHELINAFERRPEGTGVLYPIVRGERGNPVVFSADVIAILRGDGNEADFRRFIDQNPTAVYRYDTDNTNFITDLDTREDIDRFQQRTGLTLQWPAGLG